MISDELKFVNAFIGFCTPMANTWPDPLSKLDYQPVGIEREIHTSVGGMSTVVVPELVCASTLTNHVFCLDVKSTQVKKHQATRYLALTPSQIYSTGILPSGIIAKSLSHDVLFTTESQNTLSLLQTMAAMSISIPLIQGNQLGFELVAGTLKQPTMHSLFSSGVSISPSHVWPSKFVLFSSRSSPADLAAPVIRALSSLIIRGEIFTSRDVAKKAVPHWNLIGTQERATFHNAIHRMVNESQITELSAYFEPEPPQKRVVPAKGAKWVTKGYSMSASRISALQSHATRYVYRIEHGIPFQQQQRLLPPGP